MDEPEAASPTANPSTDPPREHGAASPPRAGLARTGSAGLAVLRAVVPIACRLVGVLNVYSWIVIGAWALIVVLGGLLTRPVTVGSVLPFLLVALALGIPGLALRLFHGALVEVLAMPEWLRSSPDVVKSHGTELAQLVGEASVRSNDRLTSVPRDIFRSGRLLMKAHGDLPEYGRMIRLINLPFLFVVLVSFLSGFGLITFAFVLLVTTPIVVVLQ